MKRLPISTKQRLFTTLLLLFNIFFNCFAQSRYKVSCQKLNVRSAPTQKSQVLGTLVEGDVVSVENINSDWATINYKGKTSYISTTYIEKINNEIVNTNTQTNKHYQYKKIEEQPKEQPMAATISKEQSTNNINRFLWHFSIGGMSQTDIYNENSINWFAQLGGDIPIKISDIPLTIETGLRYLNKTSAIVIGDYYDYYTDKASLLEIPVRLGYDLPLGNDFSFRFGAGPYFSYMLNNDGGLQIGLEPAAAFKYKNLSLGVQYSAPIVKGYTNEIKNTLMLALTIRFSNKAWKGIGTGLIVAGATAAAIGAVVASQNSNSKNTGVADIDDNIDVSGQNQNKEDMILLSDLARKLQSEINTMERTIAQKTKSHNTQTKNTRNIRGKQVKTPSKILHSPISKTIEEIEVSSWKSVIREWQERLKWVQGHQMRGKTHISKTEWDNYTKKRTESENEARKLRRKQHKEHSDNLKNKIYSDYVYKLQSLCYSSTRSWDNAEFNWIRECQHNMKELREKSGCKKSIWETWDGVHEP